MRYMFRVSTMIAKMVIFGGIAGAVALSITSTRASSLNPERPSLKSVRLGLWYEGVHKFNAPKEAKGQDSKSITYPEELEIALIKYQKSHK